MKSACTLMLLFWGTNLLRAEVSSPNTNLAAREAHIIAAAKAELDLKTIERKNS